MWMRTPIASEVSPESLTPGPSERAESHVGNSLFVVQYVDGPHGASSRGRRAGPPRASLYRPGRARNRAGNTSAAEHRAGRIPPSPSLPGRRRTGPRTAREARAVGSADGRRVAGRAAPRGRARALRVVPTPILDASAFLAYLRDEPGAAEVAEA